MSVVSVIQHSTHHPTVKEDELNDNSSEYINLRNRHTTTLKLIQNTYIVNA